MIFEEVNCHIIYSPIEVMGDPLATDLFHKICKLKVDGFDILRSKYLALDQNDFLATHISICKVRAGENIPIMSFKVISDETSLRWGVPFSPRAILNDILEPKYRVALADILGKENEISSPFAYPSSMTICPSIKDRKERDFLVDAFKALLVFYCVEIYKSRPICLARKKVKSSIFLKEMGLDFLGYGGETLPEFLYGPYLNEPMSFMYLKNDFSQHAYKMLDRFRCLIEGRVEISSNQNDQFQKSAPKYNSSNFAA